MGRIKEDLHIHLEARANLGLLRGNNLFLINLEARADLGVLRDDHFFLVYMEARTKQDLATGTRPGLEDQDDHCDRLRHYHSILLC